MAATACPVCHEPLPALTARRCSRCAKNVHQGCGQGQFPNFVCNICAVSPPCPICGEPLAGLETRECRKCGRTVHERCGKRKLVGGFVCNEDA